LGAGAGLVVPCWMETRGEWSDESAPSWPCVHIHTLRVVVKKRTAQAQVFNLAVLDFCSDFYSDLCGIGAQIEHAKFVCAPISTPILALLKLTTLRIFRNRRAKAESRAAKVGE
jgi:hypothetical protein